MPGDPPRLDTQRLRLRAVQPEDAAATAALITPDVAANLSTWASPMTEGEALARIRESVGLTGRRDALDFAILARDSGCLLGWIGVRRIGERSGRLGYWLGSAYRGHGLMTEAAREALPAAAAFLGLTEVVALALPDNRASIGVLLAIGFDPAGTERFFFETAKETRKCLKYLWHSDRKGLPAPALAD